MITRQPTINGVSWSGAIAGALIGLILFTALSSLGMAVAGASLSYDSLSEVGWGSLIWMLVCLATAGYATGVISGIAAPGQTTKSAATLTGILAGSALLVALTMVSYNLISSAVRATASIAGGTVSAIGSAASAVGSATQLDQINFENLEVEGAFRQIGLAEEYNLITAGNFNQRDLEQALAKASPELGEAQVSATARAVVDVLKSAQQNITQTNIQSINDVTQLPQTVRSEWQRVTTELTGPQFVSRLQNQGLSAPQAAEVNTVVTQRINQLQREAEQALTSLQQAIDRVQNQVGQAANQAVEMTGDVVSTSALSWLVVAMILIGLSGLGGFQTNNERRIDEEGRETKVGGDRDRGNTEPSWAGDRPRIAGNE